MWARPVPGEETIVRWSLAELPALLAELGLERPFLVASPRWSLDVPVCGRWSEVPSHEIEVPAEADSLLAVGGGSAIDTAKNASAQTGLPVVSVPTTYSGAEWTPTFGIRSPDRRMVGGGGGANLAGIVYDVELTLDLPRAETVGTAMNALAHCAEALYVRGHNDAGRRACARGRRADRALAARRRRAARAIRVHAECFCAAPPRAARRSRSPGSGSLTRWRRRSAAATACRMAR